MSCKRRRSGIGGGRRILGEGLKRTMGRRNRGLDLNMIKKFFLNTRVGKERLRGRMRFFRRRFTGFRRSRDLWKIIEGLSLSFLTFTGFVLKLGVFRVRHCFN